MGSLMVEDKLRGLQGESVWRQHLLYMLAEWHPTEDSERFMKDRSEAFLKKEIAEIDREREQWRVLGFALDRATKAPETR